MKIKAVLLIAVFLTTFSLVKSQDKYLTKKGHIWFYSHTPLEDIEAHNNEAAVVFDSKTGDVSAMLLMKSFKFQKALMEEHFNENYMESEKFPKGQFKGKVTNLQDIDFTKDGSYKGVVDGTMTVHGVDKKLQTNCNIDIKDGKLYVKFKFTVTPQEFSITIPDLVANNIAKSIDVNIDLMMEVYKK